MNYRNTITVEPGKRGGKACIRGMRITVYDVLGYLAAGMTHREVLDEFRICAKRTSLPAWPMWRTENGRRWPSERSEAPLRPQPATDGWHKTWPISSQDRSMCTHLV